MFLAWAALQSGIREQVRNMARKGLSLIIVSNAPSRGPHTTAFHKEGGPGPLALTCHLLLSFA
jgi:hypothetical protein